MINFLLGIVFLLLGYKIIVIQKFSNRGGVVDFSSPFLHWSIGLFFIFAGLYFIYMIFIKKI